MTMNTVSDDLREPGAATTAVVLVNLGTPDAPTAGAPHQILGRPLRPVHGIALGAREMLGVHGPRIVDEP